MKVVGENNEHNYKVETFKMINKMQKNLIGYLKSKYPRSGQSFVPGELTQKFRNFDMVERP